MASIDPQRYQQVLASIRGIASPSKTSPSPQSKRVSSPSGNDKEPQADPAVCRPWSRDDFLARISTFGIRTWFAKPPELNPSACARMGWVNDGLDMLHCLSCHKKLCFKMSTQLDGDSAKATVDKFAKELESGHEAFCGWFNNPCPASFVTFPLQAAGEMQSAFQDRAKELAKQPLVKVSGNLPIDVLHEDWRKLMESTLGDISLSSQSACLLALFGWESKGSPESPILFCPVCRREAGSWNFELIEPSAVQSKKRARTDKDTEGEGQRFDALNEHREFCMWISGKARCGWRMTVSAVCPSVVNSEIESVQPQSPMKMSNALAYVRSVLDAKSSPSQKVSEMQQSNVLSPTTSASES